MDRYKLDSFFRTECNIVILLVGFSFLIVSLFSISSTTLYEDVTETLLTDISLSLASGATEIPVTAGSALLEKLETIRSENLRAMFAMSIAVTIIFGFLMARITLSPAREAIASQRQFIGNIAHELRTPLAIVKANTEVAFFDDKLDKDVRTMLESNLEELDRIRDIINNLLTLNAFVRSEYINFSPVDLSNIAKTVTEKLEDLRNQRQIELTVSAGNSVVVWGNSTALEQIVMNILKNSINYTPFGGRVSLTVKESADRRAELTIEDTGIGIEKKDLMRIFEPFYRSKVSRERRRGGSGLGLAIVSELVRLHYGKIVIQSEPGRGTKVAVYFPQDKDRMPDRSAERADLAKNEVAMDFSRGGA